MSNAAPFFFQARIDAAPLAAFVTAGILGLLGIGALVHQLLNFVVEGHATSAARNLCREQFLLT